MRFFIFLLDFALVALIALTLRYFYLKGKEKTTKGGEDNE